MVTYGVYLRCIFCKKREWLGKINYLPPQQAWDMPEVSIMDVVEMRGRAGMPTICSTNWIYPELYGALVEHFDKHMRGMIKTLVVSKFGPEILQQLEQYYAETEGRPSMAVADVEGMGKFLVPSGLYEAFKDAMERIKTGHIKKGAAKRKKYKGPKIFTRDYNKDGTCEIGEEWRVTWNANMVAFGYVVGTSRDGSEVISLTNKYNELIPFSTIATRYVTDRKTHLTSASFNKIVKRELDKMTEWTRIHLKRRRRKRK